MTITRSRLLLLAFSSLSLAACGGGGSDSGADGREDSVSPPKCASMSCVGPNQGQGPVANPGTGPETSLPPRPADPFAEPADGQFVSPDQPLGFYDVTREGSERPVRNDLQGSLSAMIQFGQNLTVDPSGNAAKRMPMLVSQREALLLVTPDPALGQIGSLTLHASLNGEPRQPLTLRHPDALFASDRTTQDQRPDVVYSRRTWSVVLPWDWVQPGLELTLTDDRNRTGTLAADAIDFGVPGHLVINQIQLGMLTAPPGPQHMLNKPADAASDYFQTIPAASMVLAYYEPMQLSRVMVASGVIYDTASATTGGYYEGDMRENTAKSTFSVGINLASWGVTSAGMQSQEQPQLTQQVMLHHAQGNYANGVMPHGLSGGNSILTLVNSDGNEFSHEIGHHYGLGHYPGMDESVPEKDFWNRHHADSGWGFIAYRKRIRANLEWSGTVSADMVASKSFKGLYPYDRDAMSGGYGSSSLSRYTQYTGYSTYLKIQPAFDKVQIDARSPTGFFKWNKDSRQMEVTQPKVPNSGSVWYNAADGNFRKPRLFGVPVFTILGGYDPEAKTAVLYPAARSNWGNVFNLPAPLDNATTRQCWLDVDFANGDNERIAVAPQRMGSNANKLGVNLAQAEQPVSAALFCRESAAAAALELARIEIPQNLPPMKPPVLVGKEQGYSALRAVELPTLDNALQALAGKPVPVLSSSHQLLLDSWAEFADELSPAAQAELERLQDLQQRMLRLNRWLFAYGDQVKAGSEAATDALFALLDRLALRDPAAENLLPAATQMKVAGNNCLKAARTDSGFDLHIAGPAGCSGAADETWVVDATNHIRNGAHPDMCLTFGGNVTLSKCVLESDSQTWDISNLPQIKRGNSCMDLANGYLTNGRGNLITYGCSGGHNQKWTHVSVDQANMLLPLLHPANLAIIQQLSNR